MNRKHAIRKWWESLLGTPEPEALPTRTVGQERFERMSKELDAALIVAENHPGQLGEHILKTAVSRCMRIAEGKE